MLYVFFVLEGPRDHAAAWFAREFGGLSSVVTDQMQSSAFHDEGCRVLCVISFGRSGEGWLDTTIATTKDYREPIETLSRSLLSGTERRLLDLE